MAVQSHSTEKSVNYKSLSFLGFPKYRVGDDGSVWSKHYGNWRKMVPCPLPGKGRGYLVVILSNNRKKKTANVGPIILKAFVGLPPEGMECCHNDGDRANNKLNNLRWDTKKGNQADRKKHGTYLMGERCPSAKLTWNKVRKIRRMFATGNYTRVNLGALFGVSKVTIWRIVTDRQWIE